MKPFKETAETIEGRLTFLQRFLSKKFGPEILFVVLVGAGVGSSWWFNEKGRAEGKSEGKEIYIGRMLSFKIDSTNMATSLKEYKTENNYLKKQLDTCRNTTSTENLNKEVLKRIEEAENFKRSLEQKYFNDKKYNSNLNSLIKSKS
jgi:hypothetical protein